MIKAQSKCVAFSVNGRGSVGFVQLCSSFRFPHSDTLCFYFKKVFPVGGKRWKKQHLDKQRVCTQAVTLLNLAATAHMSGHIVPSFKGVLAFTKVQK